MANKQELPKMDLPPGVGSTTPGFIGMAIGALIVIFGLYLVGITETGSIGINNISLGVPVIIFGLIWILFFRSGFMNVKEHQMGVLIRRYFGNKMPQGYIIARTFDQIGIQADTLQQGFYWFNPVYWGHEVINETPVGNEEVGLVTAIDGKALPDGRLLGDEVPECNNFQDARVFLVKGFKGPQIGYLKPGRYRINTKVFSVQVVSSKTISENHLGTIVAKDGKSLPTKYLVAPEPSLEEGKTVQDLFQNPQAFIDAGGYRGPQLATLQPGKYYINTLLFNVQEEKLGTIDPGYVGVIISKVGEELAEQTEHPIKVSEHPDLTQAVHEATEVVLQTNMKKRGIIRDPVAPGSYNLNPLAYDVKEVPTSAVTIDWASDTKNRETLVQDGARSERSLPKEVPKEVGDFFRFGQLLVTSKDGFQLKVDVRLIIRISADNASFVIARFGTVFNLIEQIAHPLIDASFRNNAGEKEALKFVQGRTELQEDALKQAIDEFSKYHIEVQKLLISYIDVDKGLLETQTKKEIAIQQKTQYKEEAAAQEARSELEEKRARAEKQKEMIDAEMGILIAENNAKSAVKTAEGARDARKAEAIGESEYIEKTGRARGAETEAVGLAKAKAYERQVAVLGPNGVAFVNIFDLLSSHDMKIVPDILVSGAGENGAEQGLMATLMNTFSKGGGLTGSIVVTEEALMKKAKDAADQQIREEAEKAAKAAEKPVTETDKAETSTKTDAKESTVDITKAEIKLTETPKAAPKIKVDPYKEMNDAMKNYLKSNGLETEELSRSTRDTFNSLMRYIQSKKPEAIPENIRTMVTDLANRINQDKVSREEDLYKEMRTITQKIGL